MIRGYLQNSEPDLGFRGAREYGSTLLVPTSVCNISPCRGLMVFCRSPGEAGRARPRQGSVSHRIASTPLTLQSTHIDGHKKNSVRHKLVSLTLKKKSKLTEEVRGDAWPPGSTRAVGLSAALSDSLLLFPRQHRTSPPLGLALPVSLPERFKECLRGKVGFPCLLESFCTSRRPPLGSRSPSIRHLPSPLPQPSI